MTTVTFWQEGDWHNDANVHAHDRGFTYGDGLFETIRISSSGKIPFLEYHQRRMVRGLESLLFTDKQIETCIAALHSLVSDHPHNDTNTHERIIKLQITRGVGPRGYTIPEETTLTVIRTDSVAPHWRVPVKDLIDKPTAGYTLKTSKLRLAHQPMLAGIKHLNRLEQILLSNEIHDVHDVLAVDIADNIIETTNANIILKIDGSWQTPDLSQCGVEGVIRNWLLDHHPISTEQISRFDLQKVTSAMICNSVMGIIPVRELNGTRLELAPECELFQSQLESLYQ